MNKRFVARLGRKIRRGLKEHAKSLDYSDNTRGNIDEDLCGGCALAATIIAQELRKLGKKAHVIWQDSHCWTECDGYIIDVTATQFDGPEISISKIGEKPNKWFWYRDEVHGEVIKNPKRKFYGGWPDGTEPYPKNINLVRKYAGLTK